MESSELSITVGELIGVPKVTLSGYIDVWHQDAVSGVLEEFRDQGTTSLVLDIARMHFAGTEAQMALIKVLRSLGPEICVHTVTSGMPARILREAHLGPCIRLYSTTDEIAEYLSPNHALVDSTSSASRANDSDLPLAA